MNSCPMVLINALSLSGRFKVMVRICSAISYFTVSYAVGVFLAGLDEQLGSYLQTRVCRRTRFQIIF